MPIPSTELWALDMDRTLVNLRPVVNKLIVVCKRVGGIDTDALEAARAKSQQDGGSFDVLGHLKETGTPARKIINIQDRFAANEEGDDFLYPDARVLLSTLDETNSAHIIPTFGGKDWQQAKLEATGLSNRPHLVTDKKDKGELIGSWRQEDGAYQVVAAGGELLVAQSVNLVDDKAIAFGGLPADCRGYHLARPEEDQVASQMGTLPSNAWAIPTLYDMLPAVYAAAQQTM